MTKTQTKAQLQREIKDAKNAVGVADIMHGYSSAERISEIAKLAALQVELSNREQAGLSQP